MRGWVDGRMQWPVSQHRGVIEPPAVVVWRKRRSSLSRPWTAVFRCPYFAFRVGSSFRRGCALSVCCGGGLCLPRRSGRAEPLPFSVFPNGRRDGDWCVPGRPFSAVRGDPASARPPPRVPPPLWRRRGIFGEDACRGHCSSSIPNIRRGTRSPHGILAKRQSGRTHYLCEGGWWQLVDGAHRPKKLH